MIPERDVSSPSKEIFLPLGMVFSVVANTGEKLVYTYFPSMAKSRKRTSWPSKHRRSEAKQVNTCLIYLLIVEGKSDQEDNANGGVASPSG